MERWAALRFLRPGKHAPDAQSTQPGAPGCEGPRGAALEEVAALDSLVRDVLDASMRLHSFQSESERAFLEIAPRLDGLNHRASNLVAVSAGAIRQASGEETSTAAALDRDLARIVRTLAAARESFGGARDRLSRTADRVGMLTRLQASFAQITKRMTSLAICMSLEAARLGADRAGIEAVASDVQRLANQIEGRFQSALRKGTELKETALAVRSAIEEFLSREAEWSARILDDARAALDGLRDLSEMMTRVGEHARRGSEEVSTNVGEIVTSLQFHDITRQMVEHAEEGLRELQSRLSEPDARSDPRAALAEATPLCRLQSAQIERARDHFDSAVGRIRSSLGGVSHAVGDLAHQVREVAAGGSDREVSFVARIEAGLEGTADILREHGAQEARLASSMAEVGEAIAAMAAFVQEVEEIGIDVEVLAVNSFLKAARAGAEGRALGVLAREMRQLTDGVSRLTAEASRVLRDLASESGDLERGSEDESRRSAEAEDVVAGLEKALANVRLFQGQLLAQGAQLSDGTEALEAEVRGAAERFSQQAAAARFLAEAARRLEGAADEGARHVRHSGESTAAALLRAAQSRYTMEGERSVHRATSTGIPRELGHDEAAVQSEYGGNVELF